MRSNVRGFYGTACPLKDMERPKLRRLMNSPHPEPMLAWRGQKRAGKDYLWSFCAASFSCGLIFTSRDSFQEEKRHQKVWRFVSRRATEAAGYFGKNGRARKEWGWMHQAESSCHLIFFFCQLALNLAIVGREHPWQMTLNPSYSFFIFLLTTIKAFITKHATSKNIMKVSEYMWIQYSTSLSLPMWITFECVTMMCIRFFFK
jgi:hypothetical protein